ncbi:MAG: acetylornithine transaminase [Rhodospirillaceae bacterium]|nr:acetylornithine transaminase [Rhodospirillaceae bacterium]
MSSVMSTYARVDIAFERGEGPYLFTADGRRYLDFGSGIAVTTLGHCHPHLVAALTAQAEKLWHTSNLYRIPGQERLAERLCSASFADKAFFCNSGAEALEGTIKTVRRYQFVNGRPERTRVVVFDGAFHGRTLGTLAAGANEKYREGFQPVVQGFDRATFGDLDSVQAAVGPETAAILVEPIQGDAAGVRVAPQGFLTGLREIADANGLLLAFDEVQSGIGRSGRFLAHEWDGVRPDVVALAKGLGGGFPIGAVLATEAAAAGMVPGTHGSTFGGNPLAAACANAILDIVLEPAFLKQVVTTGETLRARLDAVAAAHPEVLIGVRGRGLMIGLQCKIPNGTLVEALRKHGLLAVVAADNVVRFLPPLIIDDVQIDESVAALDAACRDSAP